MAARTTASSMVVTGPRWIGPERQSASTARTDSTTRSTSSGPTASTKPTSSRVRCSQGTGIRSTVSSGRSRSCERSARSASSGWSSKVRYHIRQGRSTCQSGRQPQWSTRLVATGRVPSAPPPETPSDRVRRGPSPRRAAPVSLPRPAPKTLLSRRLPCLRHAQRARRNAIRSTPGYGRPVALGEPAEPEPLVDAVRRRLRPEAAQQHRGVAELAGPLEADADQRLADAAPPEPGATASIRNSPSPGWATSLHGDPCGQNVTVPASSPLDLRDVQLGLAGAGRPRRAGGRRRGRPRPAARRRRTPRRSARRPRRARRRARAGRCHRHGAHTPNVARG